MNGALTFRDIKNMPAEEYYEMAEAMHLWETEWKPRPPKCPLLK